MREMELNAANLKHNKLNGQAYFGKRVFKSAFL